MIIPYTKVVYINEVKGFGVIATAPIPRGTITWVFDQLDRVFSPEQLHQLQPPCRESVINYSYRNSRGNFVFCWDNEKYINHSFHPNCCHTPYNLEIAVCDIAPGDELTNDYGFLNIIEPFAADPEGTDRDTVYPDDLRRYSWKWDLQLRAAFDRIPHVQQPLKNLIAGQKWQQLQDIANQKVAPDSILQCLYDDGTKA